MEILKLIKSVHGSYHVVFDEVPEITYEEIRGNYVGSTTDLEGNIIASHFLKRERFGKAFAGREIKLKMKNGSTKIIKDYWFDHGSCKDHGEFIGIGAGTVKELKRCYVYFSYNINKDTFEKMINEYLTREKLYEYREVEKWCKLQHKWYDVIANGKKIPFMMNKYGETVDKFTKERVYSRLNLTRNVKGKWKSYSYFKLNYKDGNRTVKIEANFLETLKATLPYSVEDIVKNCEIRN